MTSAATKLWPRISTDSVVSTFPGTMKRSAALRDGTLGEVLVWLRWNLRQCLNELYGYRLAGAG